MSDFSVADFWKHYEVTAGSYQELIQQISKLSIAAKKWNRSIVWRGQADSDWPLTSNLYRKFKDPGSKGITETLFVKTEQEILIELREWGLHSQRGVGRLSILAQLAMLQHFGAPTRLIDITFNALVAAFFATEEDDKSDNKDARLFAVDITDQLINTNRSLRDWEDSLDTPWSNSSRAEAFQKQKALNRWDFRNAPTLDEFSKRWGREWCSHYYAWKPPALDARISAQNGGFIFSGIVGSKMSEGYVDLSKEISNKSFQVLNPTLDNGAPKWLSIEQLKKLTCLPIRPQKFPENSVRSNTTNAVYSIRIEKSAKQEIRNTLREIYGYSHATIYPDYAGFSSYWAKKLGRS